MKISLEIHSGDVNNDSGLSEFSIHFFPESLIHISPESLFTISRNDYSHAPEYARKLDTAKADLKPPLCSFPEGRVSAVRRNPKGMRRSTGP